MTLRLDPERLRELQRLARDEGVRPGQLAQRWVEERLAGGGVRDAAVPGVEAAAPTDTSGLSERVESLAARLEELAAKVAGMETARSVAASPARAPATDGRRARLHEEIVAVLEANREPMSAGEIAQAIRERGHFRAPRSNEQVNGAMVSGRVSNPHYRALFVREGRKIGLSKASPEG